MEERRLLCGLCIGDHIIFREAIRRIDVSVGMAASFRVIPDVVGTGNVDTSIWSNRIVVGDAISHAIGYR